MDTNDIEYEINNDAIPSWIELTESSIDSYNSKYTVIVKPSRDFDERKAQMVSNLLVVLCGNHDAQPIVNSGSIY